MMFIRAYLRASTDQQNVNRARQQLAEFTATKKKMVASWYAESISGTSAQRPELSRLLSDAQPGDILLVESIDRLSRLPATDWQRLKAEIDAKGLRIVAPDLPTSHAAMTAATGDEFTARMLDAINSMMLDMMAAIARKDYEQRRQRQAQGIELAKAQGKYRGKPKNVEKRSRVAELLSSGLSIRKTAKHAGVSVSTVQDVKKNGV